MKGLGTIVIHSDDQTLGAIEVGAEETGAEAVQAPDEIARGSPRSRWKSMPEASTGGQRDNLCAAFVAVL